MNKQEFVWVQKKHKRKKRIFNEVVKFVMLFLSYRTELDTERTLTELSVAQCTTFPSQHPSPLRYCQWLWVSPALQ